MSTVAEDRKRERAAIVGLALASLPEEREDEVRKRVFEANGKDEPPKLKDALGDLKDLTDRDRRKSHRVLSLDLLAKAADRRPDVLEDDVEDELAGFARAVVDETDRRTPSTTTSPGVAQAQAPERAGADDRGETAAVERDVPSREERSRDEPADPRVPAVVSAFRAARSPDPEEHHWKRFARAAKRPLQLTDAEIDRPLCTDEQVVVMPGNLRAVRTAVWFWSDKPAETFATWTDPREWARDCGLFFKSVVPKEEPGPQGDEFCAPFTETINVGDDADLSTELVFRRSIEGNLLYALEFDLPRGTLPDDAKIVVDAGQVTVREDPHAPDAKRTAMLAEKFIRFKDPAYESWPTIACDLFWTEFAITMALGC